MIKMDKKGQLSAEFVLLVGFILLVVLIFASIAGDQSEVNSVVASAKQGASEAVSERVFINSSATPVRVTTVTVTGNENKTIQIRLSQSVSPEFKTNVLNSSLKAVDDLGFNRSGNVITSNRYQYSIIIVP
ncbi:MAG: class III signal peptide-containing protein [Euryarchaeota archaeon]|nr:class III signal peptide-containing protein [Euryarchaeota archaeon]MBV1729646.1 class III signal peptide-containing protein [Methanobacterium sp.]MBU4547736.1 class III signal peptide-containing protein [Euryarchaeota archaeon]MBU4608492.1 class III signal peptide-containing protein [Euryarchaeota archaeon]MBV1755947.1 class III signal peptide-containing protein [Methanobacterium sp.]